MIEKLKKEHEDRMKKVIEDLSHAFASIRTGRASLALLDGVQVEAYGASMPLIQVASLSTPDARTIVIQPFDPNQIKPIEKALMASDLGITPNNDGRIVRLVIPALTEERRKELAKLAHKCAEEHRVGVRQVRHHYNDQIKAMEKKHDISEDERDTKLDESQKLTDTYIKKIDEELKAKEAEIMEV